MSLGDYLGLKRFYHYHIIQRKPSTTIYLVGDDEADKQKALEFKYQLEYTCLRDITDSISIYFDPDSMNTLINEDTHIMEQYREYQNIMEDCNGPDDEDDAFSKWIIRFKFSREQMLERNITMDDVHFAIKHGFKEDTRCVYSDFNDKNLIFRVRIANN